MFPSLRLLTGGCCLLGVGAVTLTPSSVLATISQSKCISSSMGCGASSHDESWKSAKTIYDFSVKDISGNEVDLRERYEGKVVLIVHVASKWGLTAKNYQQLQALYSKHASAGFRVMAFPCNQFGNQEPGTNESIQQFAQRNYGVSFDLYQKVKVNGDDAAPLWKFLKKEQPGALSFIKWNFTKFLVDRQGIPIKRFGPKDDPMAIQSDIIKALES